MDEMDEREPSGSLFFSRAPVRDFWGWDGELVAMITEFG
jgi:hypothetical protein